MTDKVDYKAFFEQHGDKSYVGTVRKQYGSEVVCGPTEEERYQAFEARLLAKLEQQRADEWGKQLCPTCQSSHTK